MAVTVRVKHVSYGTVELRDNGPGSPRYSIWVNGVIHEVSDDWDFMIRTFETKYY